LMREEMGNRAIELRSKLVSQRRGSGKSEGPCSRRKILNKEKRDTPWHHREGEHLIEGERKGGLLLEAWESVVTREGLKKKRENTGRERTKRGRASPDGN